ncbi:MAG: guanine deaminase [Woeseia sp.]
MTAGPAKVAYRASLFHCLDEPQSGTDDDAVCYIDDGVLLVEDGHVVAAGPASELLAGLDDNTGVVDYSGRLIMPGLIDCHVHFPQIDMIAAYGEQLLDWLEKYAYPAEQEFCDSAHAEDAAEFFVSQLLANGTTTALVFATVHPQSVDAIFTAANRCRMRLLSGKVLMDQNCPEALRDDASGGIEESRRLIRQWHGKGRLGYAITPRFAVTSSPGQLALAGDLAAEYPDVHVHTHLAENGDEVDWIRRQFPDRRSYLDVYRHYGLLRQRAVFAHCLHVDDEDRRTLAAAGGAIAFCPTSNLFLGSGLFDLEAARLHGIRTGIGSDVGGGTTLNLLRTLSEAYKVLQLQGQSLPVWRALYLATLGAARALYLDDRIGNFTCGKEADFIVIDTMATSLLARRIGKAQTAAGKMFALMMLADDRAIAATYVMGRRVHPG